MNYDLSGALIRLYPTAQYVLRGTTYNDLEWLDQNVPKPSQLELQKEVTRLNAEWDATEYQRKRLAEYPPMGEYLDAIYWQQQGDNSKMDAYLAAIEAVKAKYPKPQGV